MPLVSNEKLNSKIAPLSGETLSQFLSYCEKRKFPKKGIIFREIEPAKSLYYILEGSVAVTSNDEDGNEIILSYLHPGEFIGELGLFIHDTERSAMVRAKTECKLAEISYEKFDELVKNARERFGAICVESNKGVKSVLSFEREKILTLNLIIGDQSPQKKSVKYWTTFLNQETAFLIGADKIAQKANHILLFPFYKKVKRRYYEVEFQIITESPKEMDSNDIIASYAHHLERAINSSPEMWLWSHKRWKLTKDK